MEHIPKFLSYKYRAEMSDNRKLLLEVKELSDMDLAVQFGVSSQ
jgi:hypothetical protein